MPQEVFTPILNSIFDGMTISADMKDDADFFDDIENGIYQLAVTHTQPDREGFCCKKCG